MKKVLILFFVFCVNMENASAIVYITLKFGETYTINSSNVNIDLEHLITGNSIAAEYNSNANNSSISLLAVTPGISSFTYKTGGAKYIFYVPQVIPEELSMTIGDEYTFIPQMFSAYTAIWKSSDESIATIDASGKVTAKAAGKVIISCSANYESFLNINGYVHKCVITITPQLSEELSLNQNSLELNLGETSKLIATVLPENTTNKNIKWLSSNDNIAQVDDMGTVTAIGLGYCSIFAITEDNNKKFTKCLVHTIGETPKKGDVNGDGQVTITDAVSVVNIILGNGE